MMGNNLGLVELLLSGALGIGFCVYQYIAITREIARSKRDRDASATGAGHPEGEHRLDDR